MLVDSLELMGYNLDLGPGCVSPATDVFPDQNPEDEKLCWALHQGMDMELVGLDSGPETFRPEDPVIHAEMWGVVSNLMGYADLPPDGQIIPASDLGLDSWYIGHALSLLITRNWKSSSTVIDENGLANPGNKTTSTEWFQAKQMFQNELLGDPPSRGVIYEMIVAIFYNSRYTEIPCEGDIFPDATNNNMLCYTSTLLAQEGLVSGDPQDGWLHPYENMNWADISRLLVMVTGLEPVETGCSDSVPGAWYAPYMDAVCEALGGLPGYIVPGELPIHRNVALQLMFELRAATSDY